MVNHIESFAEIYKNSTNIFPLVDFVIPFINRFNKGGAIKSNVLYENDVVAQSRLEGFLMERGDLRT